MALSHGLLPLPDSDAGVIRQEIITYWNEIAQSEDLGGIPGDIVREAEARVTELLESNRSSDIYEASRITARFELTRQSYS